MAREKHALYTDIRSSHLLIHLENICRVSFFFVSRILSKNRDSCRCFAVFEGDSFSPVDTLTTEMRQLQSKVSN